MYDIKVISATYIYAHAFIDDNDFSIKLLLKSV